MSTPSPDTDTAAAVSEHSTTTIAPPRALHLAMVAIGASMFAAAIWLLHRELAAVHAHEVLLEFTRLPASSLVLAAALTLMSYLAISGYDVLGWRWLGRALPYQTIAPISLIASAVGQTVGFALVSGGAIRYRLYSALGLEAVDIARLIGFIALTYALGVSFVAGAVFILQAHEVSMVLPLSPQFALLAGIVALIPSGFLLIAGTRRVPTLNIWRYTVPVADARVTLAQLLLAIIDLIAAASVLYVLMPDAPGLSYPMVLSVFVIAMVAGIISHVPGGLGIFESVILLAFPQVPKVELLGAIVAYRAVYYLVPFLIAVTAVSLHEIRRLRTHVAVTGLSRAQRALASVVPEVLAVLVFIAGAVLVFSGATPAAPDRHAVIIQYLALPIIELSHLTGSLLGLALMVMAHGLQRRSALAYRVTYAALIVGIAASLAKGIDWEEALLLSVVLVVLRTSRGEFHRAARVSAVVLNRRWLGAIAVVVAGSVWLITFAYRHVEYSDALWWQIALDGHAPRSLRASFAVVLVMSALMLTRLFRPLPPPAASAAPDEVARARPLVRTSPRSSAALALLGDKRLLFEPDDRAFLMYQVQGRSWISMGEPVGPEPEAESLAWDFVELAEHYDGRPVFYQVPGERLYSYIDMGLATYKLGEEAYVPLRGFSLEGKARAELRQARRRGEREGAHFEVVPEAEIPALLPALRQVSDTWLTDKHTREKRFALGYFDDRYLCEFPCAVVRVNDKIVAFANVWASADRAELSIDLMRHSASAPKGIMDYLFTELMVWGAAQGYAEFSLGMAPLSGLEHHPLAPRWHRLGTTIFRHGEFFYNFEGLRAYKEKFDPQWRPRYLATRAGVALPVVMLDISALIAGGIGGIVKR